MGDRELLELAAMAAGIEPFDWSSFPWDPLTDDGDALRLAVKLNILVDPTTYGRVDVVTESPGNYQDGIFREDYGDDPYAATRRAIVRAAAEIGRQMEEQP